jgi:queuine tRNA-ribosyltransferase
VHNLEHYLDLVRGARAAVEAGRYAAYAREKLAAIDRHEHDPSGRPPGRRVTANATSTPTSTPTPTPISTPTGTPRARFEIVTTSLGVPAVRDAEAGEVMHPIIGPAIESERLYVAQSRLRELLAAAGPRLVLLDVGLGAASNALAALRAAEEAPSAGRALEIVSFDRDLGALALAVSDEGAARLGLAGTAHDAARALLARGRFESARVLWRLVPGDALETLPRERARAELVFWDPFSPRANPALWTCTAFAAARARCAERAALYTYSTATATRAALLLAGFFVGQGDPSGPKEQTTAAATDPALLARPLDGRWLARLERSSAPFPSDAPPDALERIRAHPQFR